MISKFKELLNQIKCEPQVSQNYSQVDLDKVKACIPEPIAPLSKYLDFQFNDQDSCVNDGLADVQKIIKEQADKQELIIELGLVKGKVEEMLDHYTFIFDYFNERVKFLNEIFNTIEPFTSEYLYWDSEYQRLLKLETDAYARALDKYGINSTQIGIFDAFSKLPDLEVEKILPNLSNLENFIVNAGGISNNFEFQIYYRYRILRIQASKSRTVSQNGAINGLNRKIEKLKPISYIEASSNTAGKPTTDDQVNSVITELTGLFQNYSGQILPNFYNLEKVVNGKAFPARITLFDIRQIDLNSVNAVIPKVKEDGSSSNFEKRINVKDNKYLSTNFFKETLGTRCININYGDTDVFGNLLNYSKPEIIPGLLYNKYGDYEGFYKRISDPIEYLYTPEDRGLTLDPKLIDPNLAESPVSFTVNDVTLYVKNLEKYEAFYETLDKTLPVKLKNEKEIVIPKVISEPLSKIRDFARREVADLFRRVENSALKLSRPLSYKAGTSQVFSQGVFEFSELDKVLSSTRSFYEKSNSELLARIEEGKAELKNLEKLLNQNTLTEETITKKVSQIKCFKKVANLKLGKTDCEEIVMKKLGTDPLNLRTLSGNDAKLPSIQTPCYWREFTNALNKISLLPIPDVTSPLFRYYPVNNIIPTPFGIVLIPIPQKWKTLFVLPSSLGTLVAFITMPIAIVGIPLPSIYVFYISTDGRKYMIVAPNFTVLYAPPFPIKYGFEPDYSGSSNNPLGLNPTDPFKGTYLKGALTTPLSELAKTEKAKRLSSILSETALGNTVTIKNKKGDPIGTTTSDNLITNYTSTFEKVLEASDYNTSNDFQKLVNSFKRDINKQFDKLGEMQINQVSELKELTRKKRQSAVLTADSENDSKKRREGKVLARKIDPISLNDKIESVLSDFNKYIDKIQLGTIKFPENTTKLNPKQPSPISAINPFLEHSSKGGAQNDKDSTNLLAKIKRSASQININDLKQNKKFDLSKNEDLKEFKKVLKEYCDEAINFLTGEKTPASNSTDSSENLAKIKEAEEKRKARLKTALAFTSLSVSASKLKLFDPAAPCCETEESLPDTTVSPQVFAAIAVFTSLFLELINGLSEEDIRSLISDSSKIIGVESIPSLFNEILSGFPPISLPGKPDILSLCQATLIPVLSAITIPQASNPLGIPFPTQLVLPLDAIVKPLLKGAAGYILELILRLLADASDLFNSASSNSSKDAIAEITRTIACGNNEFANVITTTASKTLDVILPNGLAIRLPKVPMVPLDLVQYFALITSTDLVELTRNIILTAIEGILLPIEKIVIPIIDLTRSLKDLSFNIIEAGNPFILPVKLAIMSIQLQIPNSMKMRIANTQAIDLLNATYLPVLKATEPFLKEIAYLGAISTCALIPKEGVKLARIYASPIFNQDDLPPWERLTYKNPLFSIFLDEIAWRASIVSTGSLIFQTKKPSFYPSAWTPTIVGSDPGYH